MRAQGKGLDSIPLSLAKREDILVGRAIPVYWAAAPTFRPREEGVRKEPSTLGSQRSDILTSCSSLETFQVAKKNRCPVGDWCFFSACRASTSGMRLPSSPLHTNPENKKVR